MKQIAFAVVLLFAAGLPGWCAEPSANDAESTQQSFAGLPLDMMGYPTNTSVAYAKGQADARRDITNGVVAIKIWGLPTLESGEMWGLLKKRCKVQTQGLAGCCVTESLVKYGEGYNEFSCSYIQQKYGTNIFQSISDEAKAKWGGNSPAETNLPAAFARATRIYTVREGDTFTKIARKEGITLKKLEEINPSVTPTKLKVGQKLAIELEGSSAKETNTISKLPKAAN